MAMAPGASAAEIQPSALSGRAAVGVVTAIGLLLAAAGFATATRFVERDLRDALRQTAFERLSDVSNGIVADINVLYGLRGLYAASNHVDRDEFRQFVQSTYRPPNVLALEWIPRVAAADRGALERAAEDDGLDDFQVKELGPSGGMVRAGERQEYFPVYYVEPLAPNRRVLGFDLASNPARLIAMRAARDSGEAVASDPIELVQLTRDRTGYLLFLPIYRNGAPTETLQQRRQNLEGFVLAVVHLATLMRGVLDGQDGGANAFEFEVVDSTVPGEERRVFGGPAGGEAELAGRQRDAAHGHAHAQMALRSFDLAGRRLDIQVFQVGRLTGLVSWQPWFILLVGLCLTGGALFCTRVIVDRSRFAETLVAERTAELSETARCLEREIFERGAAEQGMRASENRLRDSIESISDGFALYDSDDRLVLWNARYEEFDYRIRKHLMPGVTYRELTRLGAETGQWRDSIVSKKAEAFEPRDTEPRERQLTDGRWLLIRSHPTSDGGLVDIRTDITDLKLQNEELSYRRKGLEKVVAARTRALEEQAIQLAESLEKEKQYNALQHEFVSMVSHEFRTPLAIIDSTAQRIERRKETMTPDDLGQRVGKVRNAVKRLTVLIDDTLSMSRLEAGRIAIRPQPTDLGALLNEVRDQQQQMTRRHHIHMDIAALPETVVVDPELMRQVFINLLSNAVKYSPDADLVEVTGRCDDDGAVVIAVRDYGLGIPAQDQPRLFDRFFRATNVTGIAGTGIGLNLVKRLVELHAGTMAFDSVEGEGTTFTLRLPSKTEAELVDCAGNLCAAAPVSSDGLSSDGLSSDLAPPKPAAPKAPAAAE